MTQWRHWITFAALLLTQGVSSDFLVTVPIIYHEEKQIDVLSLSSVSESCPLHLTVELNAFHRNLIVDIQLNQKLVTRNFVEKYYLPDGTAVVGHPDIKSLHNCYYQGRVRSQHNSSVALSICQGLRGMINSADTFFLEPSHLSNGEHYVYRTARGKTHGSLNDGTSVDSRLRNDFYTEFNDRLRRSVKEPANPSGNNRYVELFLVADNSVYKGMSNNRHDVTRRLLEISNLAGSAFSNLGVFVALTGVEIWSADDHINITTDVDETLSAFVVYNAKQIRPFFKSDTTHLITRKNFNNVYGKAYLGTVCVFSHSVGATVDIAENLERTAKTLAHELGHSLGFDHDSHTCKCPQERCLMAPESFGSDTSFSWSDCSSLYLMYTAHLGRDICLLNVPDSITYDPECGNGLVEDGEQCDCGLVKFCSNKCCQAETCKLVENAHCATGPCCDLDTCSITAGSVCRVSRGFCDTPEYCTGETEFCPADLHKPNGTRCSFQGENSYCYNGKCNTVKGACQQIYGPASVACHENFQLNALGGHFGDCGHDFLEDTVTACHLENVGCGRLHCYLGNPEDITWLDDGLHNTSYHQSATSPAQCAKTVFYYGEGINFDRGMAPDGTVCGDGKICLRQECKSLEDVVTCGDNCNRRAGASGTCMNGKLDPGEECDCGLPNECTNKCCHSYTCRLVKGASCAHGGCCNNDTCQYKDQGAMCRPATGVCDLAEYCSGRSSACPEDRYKMNGIVCVENVAFCFNGECNTNVERCQFLWGSSASVANRCFVRNRNGDATGDCGHDSRRNSFIPCSSQDVKCGRLHCAGTSESLAVSGARYSISRVTKSAGCSRVVLVTKENLVDLGLVPNGTQCGTNKMCVHQRCRDISRPDTCLCSSRGVCDNAGDCYCDSGYAPPTCSSPGVGGSVHSGAPAPSSNCGNGRVDRGEECDCGIPCLYTSRCCTMTCRLKTGSQCFAGGCCNTETCQVLPARTVCRESRGTCDVEETCDGVSSQCPADHFTYGDSCTIDGERSYCYEGKCVSRNTKCRLLWGSSAHVASVDCYKNNSVGNQAGHCGYDSNSETFQQCLQIDLMCGLLQCSGGDAYRFSVYPHFMVNHGGCRAITFSANPDLGMTEDGSICGIGKVCVNATCQSIIPRNAAALSTCMNGIVEPGEQCDCGLPSQCNHHCCIPWTCTLNRGSQCADGPCCDLNLCLFKPSTEVCRDKTDTCDLAEYCRGNSKNCPNDRRKRDRAVCRVGSEMSYCYKNKCVSHTQRCRELFGPSSRAAQRPCYRMNREGSIRGNCGVDNNGKHYKCEHGDRMCGLLFCTNEGSFDPLSMLSGARKIQFDYTRHQCKALHIPGGARDIFMVPDGSVCSREKICISHRCVPAATLTVSGYQGLGDGVPATCGDGKLDAGEVCDCGPPWQCTNRCCNPSTCTLAEGVQCAKGECCDLRTCQHAVRGTLCRRTASLCDLPEYCSGSAPSCPENLHKQDGSVCVQGEAHCFNGVCGASFAACSLLGGNASRVNVTCFSLNRHGDSRGNCGYNFNSRSFLPCDSNDVRCGRLHCTSMFSKLDGILLNGYSKSTSVGCHSVRAHDAQTDNDFGMVVNGNSCGHGKMCVNHRCRSIASVADPCNCNGHGVCDNKGNCHCDYGYAPPRCEAVGTGGSVGGGQSIKAPINGRWSAYGNWSPCSSTCGGGVTFRSRKCTNPSPQFGGSYCTGLSADVKECNKSPCPDAPDDDTRPFQDGAPSQIRCRLYTTVILVLIAISVI